MLDTQTLSRKDLVPRFQELTEEIEAGMPAAQPRLKLATEMFAIARLTKDDRQLCLNALQYAVRLDPFKLDYRLALANVEYTHGLVDPAIKEYRRALKYWPESQRLNLHLGDALLAAGKISDARQCFEKVSAEGQLSTLRFFGLIECDLRQAKKSDDWEKVLHQLEKLDPTSAVLDEKQSHTKSPQEVHGLLLEKCLKIALECNQPDLRQQALQLAQEKLGANDHPALNLLKKVASHDPPVPTNRTSALEGMLLAYRLGQQQPISANGSDDRLKSLLDWQALLEEHGQTWPGLQDAYIAGLDDWAHQAYSRQSFNEASALWSEIERLSPEAPEVLHNLALVSTREQDESAYEWYWQRATSAWILHSEMFPAARGYKAELIQKHRAFIEGAQKKLQTIRTWQELLELGDIWAGEALGYFTLQQLEFHNPLFCCGIQSQDFSSPTERDELLEIGYQSLETWIQIAAEQYGLNKQSTLLAKWQAQAEAAYTKATQGSNKERYHGYEDEEARFQLHRELLVSQYILLLFQVLHKVCDKIDLGSPAAVRERYKRIVTCVLGFPHRLLKPEVLKVVKGLEADVDMQRLARGIALRPWLEAGQKYLKDKQPEKASVVFGNVLSMAPDFIPGMLLLAQSHALQENFDRAYKILENARSLCKPDDEILEQIETFAGQMDIARINKRLKTVHQYLEDEKPAAAVDECQKVVKDFPENAYVQFTLAQALVADLEISKAKTTLRKVLKLGKGNKKLAAAAQKNLDELTEYGGKIILSKAVPKMQAKDWQQALSLLEKGNKLRPRDARVTFYAAICHARLGATQSAEEAAKRALRQVKEGQEDLKDEISAFRGQIPLMAVEDEFKQAQAAMEKEEWRQALRYLNIALKKAPDVLVIHFYKVLCHFRLEEWDAAEEYAFEALPLCKPKDKNIRDQLNMVIEQIPLARVKNEMDQAQAAIEKERWKEALGYLDTALSSSPDNLPALFYQALCHFRLGEWRYAQAVAKRALPLCGSKDGHIKEQLETLLEQIPLAKVKRQLDAAQEAIQEENWRLAHSYLDVILQDQPKHKVALFLSAVAYFRSRDLRMAKQVADKAIKACHFRDDANLLSQLNDLKSAIDQAERGPASKKIIDAINSGDYMQALKEINRTYKDASKNPEAMFLTSVCAFRLTMDNINSGKYKPKLSDFDGFEKSLNKAKKLAKGNQSLISQIDGLLDNIKSVRSQLRRAGIR